MVWPMKSGTIVERRDQVFTTFFSLRVFSPSTFSRKCPSTNGPFFSERAISLLFLDAAQTAPLGMPHLLKSLDRPGNAMRFRAKRANKARSHRIRRAVYDDRPSGLAQLVKHRLERDSLLANRQSDLDSGRLGDGLGSHALDYALAGPLGATPNCRPAPCRPSCDCPSGRCPSC